MNDNLYRAERLAKRVNLRIEETPQGEYAIWAANPKNGLPLWHATSIEGLEAFIIGYTIVQENID